MKIGPEQRAEIEFYVGFFGFVIVFIGPIVAGYAWLGVVGVTAWVIGMGYYLDQD